LIWREFYFLVLHHFSHAARKLALARYAVIK